MQDAVGADSGAVAAFAVDPYGTLKNRIIGFVFFNNRSYCICFGTGFLSLARNTLICSLRFDLLKLMQVSLL